ncbi:MAG: DUF1501 domain-containing protein [Acidobacteriia bacterium]|nr:DUF1501 domain-containing protein [Terriglobia bacterium]
MKNLTNEQVRFEREFQRNPHSVRSFSEKLHLSRRNFLNMAAAGVTASWLAPGMSAAPVIKSTPVTTKNKAKNVIFILLTGAPSHTDTFDLKVLDGITPSTFNPATINGLNFPTGLMPKLAAVAKDFTIVRSMRAWALVHSLSQTWNQIGRNPAGVLGNVSPNIGSVVALEMASRRTPSQVFPSFLALNANAAAGPGYMPAGFSPFKVTPSTAGLRNTTNSDGQTRFEQRWDFLHHLDDPLRKADPRGETVEDLDQFYTQAKGLTYNPVVAKAFSFTAGEAAPYGSTGFGNACLLAKQALAANQGTRYIEIMLGGWDMHQNIYAANQLPNLTNTLDKGLSQLITDLKANGLFDETLIVMCGEFGRTTGRLTGANGRDHHPQQFALFAGAGVKGGRAIGATDASGSNTADPGWSRNRDIKPEDIEATIYSALGINWTTIRYDDPLGRGYYYVPNSDTDVYGPINELWA